MFDHFVIDKKKDLLIKTFNETEQQEFKPNESINIRVYLSYDIIYSSILNYASR